ncbi:hypothetical protein YC2023_088276 [Brassica napus]
MCRHLIGYPFFFLFLIRYLYNASDFTGLLSPLCHAGSLSLSLSLSLSPVPRSREGESHHRSPLSSLPCRIALSLSLPCLALEKARAATGLLSPLCHAGSLSLSLLSQLHLSLSLSLSVSFDFHLFLSW